MPRGRHDEERLTADIIALARLYGRYGYRKITALLRAAGWRVNDKRVERIWKREGLKVPPKQPKRGRLWLTDRASGCGRSTPTMSGPTTLSNTQALQCGSPARLLGLPPTRTRGVHSGVCRVAGGASWISFAGHAPAGAQASSQLTFVLDHQLGADHMMSNPDKAVMKPNMISIYPAAAITR